MGWGQEVKEKARQGKVEKGQKRGGGGVGGEGEERLKRERSGGVEQSRKEKG